MSAAYLNAQKLKGLGKVLVAARHNLREIQAERGADASIDASKSRLNVILAGPHEALKVAALGDEDVTGKLRRDAVRAIELLIGLPRSAAIDPVKFFSESLAWVRVFFSAPVLSAVIHMDEAELHCHVLILPLVDGRMIGSALVGNRARLRQMQGDFYLTVSSRFGLSRPVAAKRTNKATRDRLAGMVLSAILSAPESLRRPLVQRALIDAIARCPDSLAVALGLTIPVSKVGRKKSFVQIMTSPVSAEPKTKPIGIGVSRKQIGEGSVPTENSETYLCVGFRGLPSQPVGLAGGTRTPPSTCVLPSSAPWC